ncbi:MAG TPA: serine hydrolase domain-containing protein [Longimicrobiaceae bacterium]|nr:serine hydrolase domain-containing protein [Longimicrobiaceae bacterium]
MRTYPFIAPAVCLLLAAPVQAQAPAPRPSTPPGIALEQGVDAAVGRAMQAPIVGISVAVARGDQIILEKGYGLADRESGRPATRETVFEIGSITKQFTAAAVLRLAEEGKLSLDDGVGEHLPELRERGAGIRLRHLLSHTSGLSSAWAVPDLGAPSSPGVVVDSLAARPVEFAPGERFAYNNNGYILLGRVVEKVSGMPYPEYLRTRFLAPLGLASIAPCDRFPAGRRAKGYRHPTRGPAVPAAAESHHPTVTSSAGILCATAGDLLRWERALATGRVVRPESYRLMTTRTVLGSGRPAGYGMGMQVMELDGRAVVGHGGGLPGFVTEATYVPGDSLGVVVLTNGVYAGQLVRQLSEAIAREALGLPRAGVADLPIAREERARFVGTYDMGAAKVEVFEQGDRLRAQPQGQIATRLLYQGDGTFRAEHDPSLHLHFRLDGGVAQELTIEHGGRKMPPAKRVP